MFIISKIVRGRRLLHEMEENTKENESKQRQQKKERESPGIEVDDGPNTSDQNADASLSPGIMSRRKTWAMEHGHRLSQILLHRGNTLPPRRSRSERRARKATLTPRNSGSKTVRQKTESSLPEDSIEGGTTTLDVKTGKLRRTSSMPSVCDDVVAAQKYNADGKLIRHYNYESKLSKLQKRSLRFTWHRLQTRNGGKRVETVFEEVFERLMKQMPLMREIFTTRTFLSAMSKNDVASLRDHARMTVKMIDTIIKNLDVESRKRTDTESDIDPRILGKAHGCLRPYGFTANFWEKLGEIMVDVVLIQEAVRDLPGAGQAWVVLTACIVDQLRAGFDQAKEPFSKNSLTGPPPQCPAFHPQTGWQNQQSFERQQPLLHHQDEYYDDDENEHHLDHTYVNFPLQDEEKQSSPRCPYSGHQSQQTSPQSPNRPVTRQLPEEPITSIHRHPSFQLVVDHSVDPIH